MSTGYDHPNFLIIRQDHKSGTISVSASDTAYAGSTLRVYTKAVVLGVWARIGSGGSASGANTFKIARAQAGGTVSHYASGTLATTISAGASAAGDTIDISLSTPLTLVSAGEFAALVGKSASLDKIPVLSDIIWRYRVLFGGDVPSGG